MMPNQIKGYVIECFEKNLGVSGLTGKVAALPNGEAWVTIYAADPTPAMESLARMLEVEFEEREKTVTIFVRRGGEGWLSRVTARLMSRAA